MTTWCIANLLLAFFSGSYLIAHVVLRVAEHLADDADLNNPNSGRQNTRPGCADDER